MDASANAVATARRAGSVASFVVGDMRDVASLPGTFDAIINLWQSFGYYDAATNADILRQAYDKLNPDGRLILDVYHREFFAAQQGTRRFERGGRTITETKQMTGGRLRVTLDYGSPSAPDVFEWQLYAPDELCALAESLAFRALVRCAWYDESRPATSAQARMQLVMQKA
jgi:SAM-dependent methyltransferase